MHAQFAQGFHPRELRHREIQKQNVGFQLAHEPYRLVPVGCLPDYLIVWLVLKETP